MSQTSRWPSGGSGGTVTSVAMTVPTILTLTGSPITSSGTLALSLATQAANLVLAGPTTGAAATPTFRSLVAADIPVVASSAISYSAGTPADWATAAPTTVKAAIDRLADAVAGLLGTAIP